MGKRYCVAARAPNSSRRRSTFNLPNPARRGRKNFREPLATLLKSEKTAPRFFAKCRKGLVRAPAAVRRAAQTPCCSALEDMAMRTDFDFAPFYRSTIGFDR